MIKDRTEKGLSLIRLGKSFRAAASGFGQALRTEQNMRLHLIMAILVVLVGIWLEITGNEWMILAACIVAVMVVELLNTAIEYLSDVVRDEVGLKYETTKYPRDMAAAAVLLVSMAAAAIGLAILLPHFIVKIGW